MTYTGEDSLTLTEQEDGSLKIEWDHEDPRYSMFNGLSEEEMQSLLMKAIKIHTEETTDAE